MKKTLSLSLLFCLLASNAGSWAALVLGPGPVVALKTPVIETQPAVQDLPDTWGLESSDDEVSGDIEKQSLTSVAAPPEWFALTCQFQPGLPARSSQLYGGSHRAPLYILLSSYRI